MGGGVKELIEQVSVKEIVYVDVVSIVDVDSRCLLVGSSINRLWAWCGLIKRQSRRVERSDRVEVYEQSRDTYLSL